ncbi:MAG: glycine-rich domain-containing protein [Candidatus Nanopelagicaceae bacterium]
MTIVQAPFFQNHPTGQIIYTEPGTYTFTVPDDVFFLTAVCVGGGGAAAWGQNGREQSGGGGGGLRYINYLPVTPGEILTVTVGAGGLTPSQNTPGANNGSASNIKRGSNTLIEAGGGGGSSYENNAPSTGGAGGTGTTIGIGPFGGIVGGGNGGNGGDSDGATNAGGGGAGGYSGNGGNGASAGGVFSSGSGGGAAGGEDDGAQAGGGGGVNIFEEGTSGTTASAAGSSGTAGGTAGTSGNGGLYGGGGGGADNNTQPPTNGGNGAVRIIWGKNRNFPNNRTTNILTGSTLLYDTAFASSNATTNGSITVPSIANGDLYLFILYENDTLNRPTISGFEIIRSDNGLFDGGSQNSLCTRVLLKGKATPGSTITIPNDATYNGFVASLIGFTNGTNVGPTVFQGGVADASFSITNGYYIMMANHDGLTEDYDTWNLDADFTRTFTYLTVDGAVTGRSAAIGVVEPVVQSGTITPSRPAVGATLQTQGTQVCFLYIN